MLKRLLLCVPLVAVLAYTFALIEADHAQAAPATSSVMVSTTSEALTFGAPTLVTQGMVLDGITGYRVTVCAASGQTLSGAGALNAYYWNPVVSAWARVPALDIAVGASSVRCEGFGDLQTFVARGRVFYAATGVTVSSGTTVTVYIEGSQR
jgi:hypothetical protein